MYIVQFVILYTLWLSFPSLLILCCLAEQFDVLICTAHLDVHIHVCTCMSFSLQPSVPASQMEAAIIIHSQPPLEISMQPEAREINLMLHTWAFRGTVHMCMFVYTCTWFGVWRLCWFNYRGLFLYAKFEFTCLSGCVMLWLRCFALSCFVI